ncbi:EAL domain-containing protein [Methylobacterium sp. NFXW15]
MLRRLRFHRSLTALLTQSSASLPAVRQVAELQKQIPTLYLMLCVNVGGLAVTHVTLAPVYLTIGFPVVALFLCILRIVWWWRLRPKTLTEEEADDLLMRTTIVAGSFSIVVMAWAMTLHQYGGFYEQGHVAIFVAVTMTACIFCLTHLPVAAFLIAGIVLSVFLAVFMASGNRVFLAITVNTAFVTAMMVRNLVNNYRSFAELVASKAEASRLSDENARLAQTDSLTGLPSRRYFLSCLEETARICEAEQKRFGLAVFDLDQFKPINDTYGHTVGDRVLAETGRRLAAFAGPEVTVARLGGDEFGVILHNPGAAHEAIAFCDRICTALQEPIRLNDIRVVTGCSCGLAKFPRAGHEAAALFDRADYALYHSKLHHRGATTLFSREHEDAIRAERAVETALRTADLSAEMELHYQPILDTVTGAITLVEALARWTSPVLGQVGPDRFVAAAERCGLVHGLTLLLLSKALTDCRQFPNWVGLSFNLSAHDLVSPEAVQEIIATVRESGIDPRRLTLELTETALMRDFDQAKAGITSLRALGITIALDDFGTGYSSLSYVHRLPLDKIKIDRSFMAGLDTEVGGRLISTIVSLCRTLGLDGIVEGVETAAQREAVQRQGCRYIQGYLIGRPMPLRDLLAWLAQDPPPKRQTDLAPLRLSA